MGQNMSTNSKTAKVMQFHYAVNNFKFSQKVTFKIMTKVKILLIKILIYVPLNQDPETRSLKSRS